MNNAYQLLIRDLDPPSVTQERKKRAILTTPIPSPKSSTESLPSIGPSQLFRSRHSNTDSQTTPSSSLGGSLTGLKPLSRNTPSSLSPQSLPTRYRDTPINISNVQISSQATDGSVSSISPLDQGSWRSRIPHPSEPPARFPITNPPGFRSQPNIKGRQMKQKQ